jgi:hypothetical protein
MPDAVTVASLISVGVFNAAVRPIVAGVAAPVPVALGALTPRTIDIDEAVTDASPSSIGDTSARTIAVVLAVTVAVPEVVGALRPVTTAIVDAVTAALIVASYATI